MSSAYLYRQICLKDIDIDIYKNFHPSFTNDLYDVLNPQACIEQSQVYGGTSRQSVLEQITSMWDQLATWHHWLEEKTVLLKRVEHELGIE